MKLHILKIKDDYFSEVAQGKKKPKSAKMTDTLKNTTLYTLLKSTVTTFSTITHVLENVSDYGLKDGYCILSIERLK